MQSNQRSHSGPGRVYPTKWLGSALARSLADISTVCKTNDDDGVDGHDLKQSEGSGDDGRPVKAQPEGSSNLCGRREEEEIEKLSR